MKKTLGFGLMSLWCCSAFYLFAEETLTPIPTPTPSFVALPDAPKPKSTLQKMSQDTRNMIQDAFQQDQQKPVNLLVQVVENPYAVSATSSKNTDGAGASNNSTTGLSGFLSDPGQAINNLFSPTGAIGQVGVGLTVHF